MNTRIILLSFLVFAISACSPTPSSEISVEEFANDVSGDIYITVAERYNTGPIDTRVGVNLSNDRSEIILSDGDQLVARLNGEKKDLGLLNTANFSWEIDTTYGNSFNGDRSGSTVTVALSRNGTEYNGSSMQLPLPIGISAPSADETFSIDDSISIAWTPDDLIEALRVTFVGWCKMPDGTQLPLSSRLDHTLVTPDTGLLTIVVKDLYDVAFEPTTIPPNGAVCPTNVKMTRKKIQRSGFQSGEITATQYDEVMVTFLF